MSLSKPKHTQPKSHAVLSRILALELLIVLVVLGVMFKTPIHSAYALASTHQPETYTELYFTNVVSLPKQVTVGRIYNFGFKVVNHESRIMTYHYAVTIQYGTTTQVLATKTVAVPAAGSAIIPVSFEIDQLNQLATLKVTLAEQHESISFRSQS